MIRNPPGRCLYRRGFILLFGSKRIMANDSGESVDAKCPRCGEADTLSGKHVRSWFTIFFIPLFPVSGGQWFTQCSKCGASFAMPPDQFVAAAARADAKQLQRAIAMYNSLRASPGNSVTLNELMQLYGSIAEYPQAISAATDFPRARDASEQCMATLGRMHLAMNDYAAAIHWFDLAIERNVDQADAQYFKALAHLRSNPSDLQKAASAARAARKAEYPGADELVMEVEAKMSA